MKLIILWVTETVQKLSVGDIQAPVREYAWELRASPIDVYDKELERNGIEHSTVSSPVNHHAPNRKMSNRNLAAILVNMMAPPCRCTWLLADSFKDAAE